MARVDVASTPRLSTESRQLAEVTSSGLISLRMFEEADHDMSFACLRSRIKMTGPTGQYNLGPLGFMVEDPALQAGYHSHNPNAGRDPILVWG